MKEITIKIIYDNCKENNESFGVIYLETVSELRLRRFSIFCRGLYTKVDMTPDRRIENRLKRTRKLTEA